MLQAQQQYTSLNTNNSVESLSCFQLILREVNAHSCQSFASVSLLAVGFFGISYSIYYTLTLKFQYDAQLNVFSDSQCLPAQNADRTWMMDHCFAHDVSNNAIKHGFWSCNDVKGSGEDGYACQPSCVELCDMLQDMNYSNIAGFICLFLFFIPGLVFCFSKSVVDSERRVEQTSFENQMTVYENNFDHGSGISMI
ncbi:MAG: hypothetical protein ACE365_05155 [Gammaproteobacteria bacterium]